MKSSGRRCKRLKVVWLGLLFLSGSWLFLTHVFTPPHWIGFLLLSSGAILNIIALREMDLSRIDRKYFLASVPLLISAWIVPFPYNLGLILLLSGLVMSLLRPFFRWASKISLGLFFTGLMLVIQSAFFPIYFRLASRHYSLKALPAIVCWLIKATGLSASWNQDTVFVQSAKEVFGFTITMEKLGFFFWANVLLGAGIILWVLGRPGKKDRWLVFILSVSVAYLLPRCAGLIFLYLDWKQVSLFWSPWITILSFVPLILLLLKFIPLKKNLATNPLRLSPFILTRNHLVLAGTSFISVLLLIGAWAFQDPGTTKEGRILIDEKHSNWEWTTQKYDTRWFGEISGYNYYCFADYLHYFYQIDRNFEFITTDLLSNYDILVIKTPTSRFSPEEMEDIRAFVESGGGLFLIGDHTNVFGTSSYLNPLAQKFGLYFNYDATYDLETGALSIYERPRLLPHPVVQRLPTFLFATSCTLKASLSAEGVITGYGLKAMYLDYSQKNFFRRERESPSMDFGLLLQSAAVKYGKGRVLAFTDSTVFSNFWMFIPGKPELLLGSINWLNRRNRFHHLNLVFLSISILALGITVFLILKTRRIEDFIVVFLSILVAFSLSALVLQKLNQLNYPEPRPHTKFVKVCFDAEHSNFALPILKLVSAPSESYHTFFVWTQRLGHIPKVSNSLEEALEEGDIVLIINPVRSFTKRETNRALTYVRQGGRIILLDSVLNQESSANQLLQVFDMAIDYSRTQRSVIYDTTQKAVVMTRHAGKIRGGEPLLFTKDKGSILSINQVGDGAIVAMADSTLFANSSLGFTKNVPNEQQLKLYDLEFWMLGDLIQIPKGDVAR